jgi:glyoxalase family protein
MTPSIPGIHHITAIASDPQGTVDFYTAVLGLRLVKLTVNFDDPGTYHLYFGNDEGSPGSIVTFFPWPGVPRGTVGNGQVSAITFAVPATSLDYWTSRLRERQVQAVEAEARFGERVLRLADPDGLPLEMVATAHADPTRAWKTGPVTAEHAICGFHSATLSEGDHEGTERLLVDVLGFQTIGNERNRYRYAAASGALAGTIVDVLCAPDGRLGRQGAGTVHHIAWRTSDDRQQVAWRAELVRAGQNVTPVIDRTYFHSIYFREPGNILFEIATDPPGFAIDEPSDHLGERLMLPKWLEPQRTEIERVLPPLTLAGLKTGHPIPGNNR